MKRHYTEIDKLRGFAILMVLLYHAVIVYPVNLHEIDWCRRLHEFLWYLEMPLFFMVSGFCFSYQSGSYRFYLQKKVKRLLIPHFAFGLLELAPRIIPNPLVNEQLKPAEAILDLLLYGGGDWFLWTLFLICLFFPLVHKLYQTGWPGRALLLSGSVGFYLFSYRLTNVLLIQMTAWFFVYFLLGYAIRQADYEKYSAVLRHKPWLAGCGLLLTLGVFWWNTVQGEQKLLTLLGVLGGACLFWQLAVWSRGAAERFLLCCGTYSLQMYLLGSYALVATRTLLVSILGIQMPLAIIVGNWILDIIITLTVSHFILKRFRVFRMISGL